MVPLRRGFGDRGPGTSEITDEVCKLNPLVKDTHGLPYLLIRSVSLSIFFCPENGVAWNFRFRILSEPLLLLSPRIERPLCV